MGTETSLPDCLLIDMISILVKLNNPLMGTETPLFQNHYFSKTALTVKKNPLMGTETLTSF